MKITIIPAAGKGLRFHELGKCYPKYLLPVDGQPLISENIQLASKCSERVYLVVDIDDYEKHRMHNERLLNLYPRLRIIPAQNMQVCPQDPVHTIYAGLLAAQKDAKEGDIKPFDSSLDSILVMLSDSHFKKLPGLDLENWFSTIHVDGWSRWCISAQGATGQKFVDKPRSRPETLPGENHARALSGLYHFTDGEKLAEVVKNVVYASDGVPELEISEVLEGYQRKLGLPMRNRLQDPDDWVDFGTLAAYQQNRGINISREFNRVDPIEEVVYKSCSFTDIESREKLFAEATWMKHGPFSPMCPDILEIGEDHYTMERLFSHNLRDLMLYYDRSIETWTFIFEAIRKFIKCCKQEEIYWNGEGQTFWHKMIQKNQRRVCSFHTSTDVANVQKLHTHIERSVTDRAVAAWSSYHGDLHPANMFWCPEKRRLQFIDPAGKLMGHWLYDVAKLYHSFMCMYDFIDAELYSVDLAIGRSEYYDMGMEEIRELFSEIVLSVLSEWQIDFVRTITATLFYSMVPLHNHNKVNQTLFLNEFRRLYKELSHEPTF